MREQLAKVARGEPLTEDEAGAAMAFILDGHATAAQIGALLAGLAVRGEVEDEIVGFAKTMRGRAKKLSAIGAIDTCGTGGDGAGTLNISTISSLVVAACGAPVAKHGNRSSSGGCGSADVLQALGVAIDPPFEVVQRSLDQIGWAFLFAPTFHASTKHATGPRRELGFRTAFNLLGPLTNPALPEAQVVGVPRPQLTAFLARCLKRLGARRAWVAYGSGLDEISLAGSTTIATLENGEVRETEIEPEDAGLARCSVDALRGGDAMANAAAAMAVLRGERGPHRDVVLLNTAAALIVAGRAADLREGAQMAAEAIDARRAESLFERARELSRT